MTVLPELGVHGANGLGSGLTLVGFLRKARLPCHATAALSQSRLLQHSRLRTIDPATSPSLPLDSPPQFIRTPVAMENVKEFAEYALRETWKS